MENQIEIIKASGERNVFNVDKLIRSLENAGASESDIDQVINEVNLILVDGITTKEIYRTAFSALRKISKIKAAKYKLKKAILELGPSGYPFEIFVSELLKYQNYNVRVGQFVQGHCIQHEVDVVALKEDKHYMVECKFHSDQNRKCDVKVPLYIQSRFLDVKKAWEKKPGHATKFHQGWIVTNTRFSEDALQYGNCVGLHLIGWDYPKSGSLKERINLSGTYPVTCLSTLTNKEKKQLLDKGVVLSKTICTDSDVLKRAGILPQKIKSVIKEAYDLCSI